MAKTELSRKVRTALTLNGVTGASSFSDIEYSIEHNPDGMSTIPELRQKLVKFNNKSYLVLNYLGKGLCGTVSRIIDLATSEIRALKVVQAPIWYPTIVSQQTNGSFRNEVDVLRTLNLFNSSSFEDEASDTRLIVFDFIEGITLDKLKPPKTAADLLILFENMANAFKVPHDSGFVHGDMKDVNFIVEPETYKVTLIDYGHCKKDPDSRIPMSVMGLEMLVCPFDFLHWGLPETKRNEKLGPGSDIYVLANKFEYALKKQFHTILNVPAVKLLIGDMRKDSIDQRPSYDEVATRLYEIRQNLRENTERNMIQRFILERHPAVVFSSALALSPGIPLAIISGFGLLSLTNMLFWAGIATIPVAFLAIPIIIHLRGDDFDKKKRDDIIEQQRLNSDNKWSFLFAILGVGTTLTLLKLSFDEPYASSGSPAVDPELFSSAATASANSTGFALTSELAIIIGVFALAALVAFAVVRHVQKNGAKQVPAVQGLSKPEMVEKTLLSNHNTHSSSKIVAMSSDARKAVGIDDKSMESDSSAATDNNNDGVKSFFNTI